MRPFTFQELHCRSCCRLGELEYKAMGGHIENLGTHNNLLMIGDFGEVDLGGRW